MKPASTTLLRTLAVVLAIPAGACTEGPALDVSGPQFAKAGGGRTSTVVLDFLEESSFDFWSNPQTVTGRNNKSRIEIDWSRFVLAAQFTDPEDGVAVADACHPGVVSTLTDSQGDDLARAVLLDPSDRNGLIHAVVYKQTLSVPMDFDFPWTDATGIVGQPGLQYTVRLGTAGDGTVSVVETSTHTLVTRQHGSLVVMLDSNTTLQVVCDGILDYGFTVTK